MKTYQANLSLRLALEETDGGNGLLRLNELLAEVRAGLPTGARITGCDDGIGPYAVKESR